MAHIYICTMSLKGQFKPQKQETVFVVEPVQGRQATSLQSNFFAELNGKTRFSLVVENIDGHPVETYNCFCLSKAKR